MNIKLVCFGVVVLVLLGSSGFVVARNNDIITCPKGAEMRDIGVYSPKMKRIVDDSAMFQTHHLNDETTGFDILDEKGRLIVICHGDFLDEIQPYVDWKRQKGIETDIYDVADVGASPDDIKDFIESEYFSDDGLTFVQFVGDYDQIPTFLIPRDFCSGDATSDPSYSLLVGNDCYPDIFVGRFSGGTAEEIETQVERTIWYERDIVDGEWLHKGAGLGSAWGEGYGYMGLRDRDLVELLRIMLLDFTYTSVDQLYEWGEPPYGIVPVPVVDFINAINDGRSILIAEGSGDCASSFTIPPGTFDDLFTTADIYDLENQYMLPFIHLGAPYLGNFQLDTTYPEAWLQATDPAGDPIGAIAVYACSTDLDYASPQAAQYKTVELLTEETLNTFGGLMYNGACYSIDLYGARGEKTFQSYTIFGDVSLQVRTDNPEMMTVLHDSTIPVGSTSFEVTVVDIEGALCAISQESILLGSAYTDENGIAIIEFDPIGNGNPVDLVVTGFNKITYIAELPVGENLPPNAPIIDGPSRGIVGENYSYTFSSCDPEESTVFLWIDWGDGETEEWIGPYDSEEEVTVKHTWENQGIFTIKAKAKDPLDAESDWGYLEVEMPLFSPFFRSFQNRFFLNCFLR